MRDHTQMRYVRDAAAHPSAGAYAQAPKFPKVRATASPMIIMAASRTTDRCARVVKLRVLIVE
jgi:hypothetical protein